MEKLKNLKIPPIELSKNDNKSKSDIHAAKIPVEAKPLETSTTLPELDYNERIDFECKHLL